MQRSIAFFCHPYHRGGVTRWMADAALAYDEKGYKVYFVVPEPAVVFYSGKNRETMIQLLAGNNNINLITTLVGRDFEFGTPQYQSFIYKKLLAKLPVGIPVILSEDKTVWRSAVGLKTSYPIVGVLHSDADNHYELAQEFGQDADIIACVSGRVSRTLRAKAPHVPPSKIFTIPCGINMDEFRPKVTPNDVLKLVYAGRIIEHPKRTGDLLKIAAVMKAKGARFQIDIIGDGGEYRVALERQNKEQQLEDCVVFHGWRSQEEVKNYMADADIVILTSDFEGMPISMMEALSMGCGFVGTRVSGIEDYEFHPLAKDCFGVFDVGNIEEAVSRIQQIAAVPVSTRQASARQLAESQFTMDICLENYNKAIDTIPVRQYTQPAKATISPVDVLKSKLTAMARGVKMAMK